MNSERERKYEGEDTKRVLIVGTPAECFGKYFNNIKLGEELIEKSIPRLLSTMDLAFGENFEVIFGGSAMEILSGSMTEGEYWHLKGEMSDVKTALSGIEIQGKRAKTVRAAIDRLSGGDPDFDLYLPKKQNLKSFFNNFKRLAGGNSEISKTESSGEIFRIQISDNVYMDTYWGPIYKDSLFNRVHLQLRDADNNPLFHIDLTALPETGVDAAQNRRQEIGDIHDRCRGKYIPSENNSFIEFNPEQIPKSNEATKMNLAKKGKEPKTFLEIVLRELRKKTMHFDSINNADRNIFSILRIYPLLNIEDVFTLRELFSKDKKSGSKIFEMQGDYQKEMIYQEFFLIAQKDPFFALEMLQDTGLDALFFGRHLTRKEALNILSSKYLNFGPQSYEINRKERIRRSREEYLILGDEGQNRRGLLCLLEAVGQVLGDEKNTDNNDGTQLQKGLKILTDPENEVKKQRNLKLGEITNENKDVLKQLINSGGLTERELHCLMNKADPQKYPNNNKADRKSFHKNKILPLIKSSLIETANREIILDKGMVKVRFYYPCVGSIKIEDILYLAGKTGFGLKIAKAYSQAGVESMEAAIGINPRDLREEGKPLMAFFLPIFLRYLIDLQRKVNLNPKTHKYIGNNN